MNQLVHDEARRTCQGCQVDGLSQRKVRVCIATEEEEIWIYHFDKAKIHLNVRQTMI